MARDRDIRAAIRDLLLATNEFDAVAMSDEPDDGPAAGGSRVAVVGPFAGDAHEPWDSGLDSTLLIAGRAAVTIISRDEDPETRDAIAEKLMGKLANAINGVSLAGITYTHKTAVVSWKWKDARPPERRLEVVIKYEYEIDGWDSFDVTE